MCFQSKVCFAIATSLISIAGHAQQTVPEQDRLTLMAKFQKLSTSTDAKSWRERTNRAQPEREIVLAIPFNSENATNSADVIGIGKKIWFSKFKNGKTLASCFPLNGKRAAVSYPQFDSQENRVITLANAINSCRVMHGESGLLLESQQLASVTAYLKNLAAGQRIAVKVSNKSALTGFELGKALFGRRMGQHDMACASCHVIAAAEQLDKPGAHAQTDKNHPAPLIGLALERPILERGGKLRTLQRQFQHCMVRTGAEPFEIGSAEMDQLEYFVSYMSNTLVIDVLSVSR